MKTTFFLTIFFALAFNSFLFSQDSQQAPAEFQKQLTRVYETYINLKEAFVSSDAKQVKERAAQVTEQLGKVDQELLGSEVRADWTNQLTNMNTHLNSIGNNEDIAQQRRAFAALSHAMYEAMKEFGISGMSAYYQYCPMALNNEGAYWLSTSQEIKNPYFGDRMIKCGKTKEVLVE